MAGEAARWSSAVASTSAAAAAAAMGTCNSGSHAFQGPPGAPGTTLLRASDAAYPADESEAKAILEVRAHALDQIPESLGWSLRRGCCLPLTQAFCCGVLKEAAVLARNFLLLLLLPPALVYHVDLLPLDVKHLYSYSVAVYP